MHYIVYKITNQINGKIYVGSHKTKIIDDGYMGSGKYLKRAQDKYGIQNFKNEVLFVFDNPKDMYQKEAEIVNDDFLVTENTYNLKIGGHGGCQVNASGKRVDIATLMKLDPKIDKRAKDTQRKLGIGIFDPEVRRKASLLGCAKTKEKYPNGTFFEKSHTEETKAKIGKANAIAQSGARNSQYGTRWIHSLNEKMSKKIAKDQPIPDGWLEGRKIKFE